MKDLLEPLIYPHNLMLFGLLLACVYYRKRGLWLLFLLYYLAGNTYLANQVRHWYSSYTAINAVRADSTVILLGCGGSATTLPACAKARIDHLVNALPQHASVIITSEYCQPYVKYLLEKRRQLAVDCFNGGENTYQEFNSLKARAIKPDYVLTSDFHAWRVKQLVALHGFNSIVLASSSQTFRRVNCSLNCFFTVNLTNFDFYSKLSAEFASYAVFSLSRDWVDWYQEHIE
jgi:hypothetical protein